MEYKPISLWSIRGKVCLITGGNGGIGSETVLGLMKKGAERVIIACRNLVKAKESVAYVCDALGISEADKERRFSILKLDLGSLESVRHVAKTVNEREPALHVLINNAGIYGPPNRSLTVDGFEVSFGTNHLGHFLLTTLLLDLLKKSAPSRIVVVASMGYLFCWQTGYRIDDPNFEVGYYDAWMAYMHSKLANILFARELHRRLNGTTPSGVTVYSLHPGMISSNLNRNGHWKIRFFHSRLFSCISSTPEQGATTSIYCATEPGIEQHSGKYFQNSTVCELWSWASNDEVGKRLWELSEHYVTKQQKNSDALKLKLKESVDNEKEKVANHGKEKEKD